MLKLITSLSLLILFVSLLYLSSTAQDFEDDPEIVDMQVRVANVHWDLSEYQSTVHNGTFINFEITLELWNPYDDNLVSYGSSSCRWSATLEFEINDTLTHEYQGEACTADFGPRFYPSGLSNEISVPSILLLNENESIIPDGNYQISGVGGTFENKSDNSYGVHISIQEGISSYDFEEIPANWGDILFEKDSEASALTDRLIVDFTSLSITSLVVLVISRVRR